MLLHLFVHFLPNDITVFIKIKDIAKRFLHILDLYCNLNISASFSTIELLEKFDVDEELNAPCMSILRRAEIPV